MNREAIYSALFTKLSAAAGFNTTSRRLVTFNEVAAVDQPALFVIQRTESAATVPGLTTVWTLEVDAYVYVNTAGDPAISPSTILNPYLDAIVTAMAPDNVVTNKATLGGLVQHAWIEGKIQTDEGVLGDQAIAIVPIILKVA